jgi:hypothetical protein
MMALVSAHPLCQAQGSTQPGQPTPAGLQEADTTRRGSSGSTDKKGPPLRAAPFHLRRARLCRSSLTLVCITVQREISAPSIPEVRQNCPGDGKIPDIVCGTEVIVSIPHKPAAEQRCCILISGRPAATQGLEYSRLSASGDYVAGGGHAQEAEQAPQYIARLGHEILIPH